jgi:division protein CdvB (Snf7/Vps24/ESCRT-III family)
LVAGCQNEVGDIRNFFLGAIMDEMPQVKTELLMPVVREQVETAVREIMEVVNAAPPGELIAASEEAVRDITGQLRKQLFEAALQQRINAAEAAFPPSGGLEVRKEERQQGPAADHGADDQRTCEFAADVVAFSGGRQRGSRGSPAVS